jgi:acetyl-CoA carboxylase biotin carboxyl carrier protein
MSDKDKSGAEDVFAIDRIRKLVELMEQHDLSAVDLRDGVQRIRLNRGAPPVTNVAYSPAPNYAPPAPVAPAAAAPAAASAAPAGDGPNIVLIKSPMVGTFYTKPNPESENFVKVGASVSPETTICIIEAMKVFNEIPAETSGKVVAVLVENGQPVEFGKPLFKIDTAG